MLDHITISVSNFQQSRAFYDAVLAPLGIVRLYADGEKAAGYGHDGRAFFWIAEQDRAPSQHTLHSRLRKLLTSMHSTQRRLNLVAAKTARRDLDHNITIDTMQRLSSIQTATTSKP